MMVKTCQELKLRYSCSLQAYENKILHFDNMIEVCVCVCGGGVRLYFMWFPGGDGGSLDLNLVRRGGSSKIWVMDRNFSSPPPDT